MTQTQYNPTRCRAVILLGRQCKRRDLVGGWITGADTSLCYTHWRIERAGRMPQDRRARRVTPRHVLS